MKKIFTLAMCLMVALGMMALPKFGKRSDRMHRTAPAEFVRKAPVKAPAVANGQTYAIEGNDLFVGKDYYFDMLMAFYGYGMVDVQGGLGGDKAVLANLYVEDEDPAAWFGEYDGEDVEGYVFDPKNAKSEDDYIEVSFESFNLAKTAKGNELTAVAVDAKGNTYNIHLTFFAPDKANDTIKIAFKEEEASLMRDGGTYLFADNKQYVATIYRLSNEIEGEYSMDDCDPEYTGMYRIEGKDTVSLGLPFDFKATVKLEEGMYNVKAEFFTSGDSIVYQVEMQIEKPTAKKTVQVNLENALLDNEWMEDYGYFDMQAAPADSSYMISLSVNSEKMEGSYTENDLDLYYSFVREGKEFVDIFEAAFTIEANKDQSYTYKGWLLTMSCVKYEFVIKAGGESQGFEQINDNAIRAQKRIENGRLLIEKNGALYDATGTKL